MVLHFFSPTATRYPGGRWCPSHQFQCNNKLCVNQQWVCDGFNDCGDRSDEQLSLCCKTLWETEIILFLQITFTNHYSYTFVSLWYIRFYNLNLEIHVGLRWLFQQEYDNTVLLSQLFCGQGTLHVKCLPSFAVTMDTAFIVVSCATKKTTVGMAVTKRRTTVRDSPISFHYNLSQTLFFHKYLYT